MVIKSSAPSGSSSSKAAVKRFLVRVGPTVRTEILPGNAEAALDYHGEVSVQSSYLSLTRLLRPVPVSCLFSLADSVFG